MKWVSSVPGSALSGPWPGRSIVGRMSVSSTHVPCVLASGTVCVEFGSCDSLPPAGPGPSTPFTATPGPTIPTHVMTIQPRTMRKPRIGVSPIADGSRYRRAAPTKQIAPK